MPLAPSPDRPIAPVTRTASAPSIAPPNASANLVTRTAPPNASVDLLARPVRAARRVTRSAWALLLVLAPRPTGAAPVADVTAPDGERKAAARRAADAATAAFAAGDFTGALAHFEQAMALRPNPALHYNVGVCHQRLTRAAGARGDPDAEARHAAAAIDAFNAYLRENPDASDRATVEALVRDLGGTPATQPQLRDPLAPLPTPGPAADAGPAPPPVAPPIPARPPATVTPPIPALPPATVTPPIPTPPPPTPPLPRGYLGAATGLVTQPQLLETAGLDGGYQAMLLARGGARLGKRRGLELGAQLWFAVPGQTTAMHLALSTQAILLDLGYAIRLGPAGRLELPLGAVFGVAREGLRVRTGQPLPACAARTTGTLVSARPGGVVGGRLGFAVLVGPRRNHELGMHIHLAFFGFGPGSAGATCDERPFAAAGIARARLVLATSVGYAFRF